MKLVEVTNPQLTQEFLDMAQPLYHDQPNWIRPLDKDLNAVFDPAKNKHFRNGEAIRWILYNTSGQAIGRVAAFIDHAKKLGADGITAGGMGFFECINNQQAAKLLFDACRGWLLERGAQAMDGPVNFGQRDRWWGLLAEGFTEPNFGMFYHPPYYRQLFEDYGFQLYFKQYTFYRDMKTGLNPVFTKRSEKVLADPAYRFTTANKKNWKKIASDLHTVYSKAWVGHSDVGELKLETIQNLVKQMLPVMDEQLIWFGYHHQEPVSFFIMLPELNQYFKHLNGRFNAWAKLKLLYLKTFRPTRKAFGLLFGVIPEHQGKGVEMAMIKEAEHQLLPTPYEHLEMNWIGDFNPKMLVIVRMLGSEVRKTHHTYRLLLDPTIPFQRYPIIK